MSRSFVVTFAIVGLGAAAYALHTPARSIARAPLAPVERDEQPNVEREANARPIARPLPPTVSSQPIARLPGGFDGYVIDLDGNRVARAIVTFIAQSHCMVARTDERGEFHVNLAAGEYKIGATRSYLGEAEPIELALDDHERVSGLELRLEPPRPQPIIDEDLPIDPDNHDERDDRDRDRRSDALVF